MKRSLVVSLVASVSIAVIAFGATLGSGWSPKLGLDLAGGSEVVYKPAHPIMSGEMDTTINVIRNRVEGAGVSGATVNSQGGNVVVQFPGVKNPEALIKLIGTTAQLYFRPVLCGAPPYSAPAKGKAPPSGALPACGSSYLTNQTNLAVTPDSNAAQGYTQNNIPADPQFAAYPSTPSAQDDATKTVLLPGDPAAGTQQYERFVLGPSELKGNAIATAQGTFDTSISKWAVTYTLTSAGSPAWDQVAQKYFHEFVAIDLDGQVESAPITQPTQAAFTSFAGQGADQRQLHPDHGRQPGPRPQLRLPARAAQASSTQTSVSPTLGKSSLKAGLAAGIGGLILVLLYTIFYYRVLGVVVVSGLVVTARLAVGDRLGPRALGAEPHPRPRRRHRPDRVRRYHRRLLHRVLRAIKGRGAQRAIGAHQRRQELPGRLPHGAGR